MSKHFGSALAIGFGISIFLAGLSQPIETVQTGQALDIQVTGLAILLGGIAYRSAKRRYLGEVISSTTRVLLLEVLPLALIIGSVVFLHDFKYHLATEPAPIFVRVLSIIPYLCFAFRSPCAQLNRQVDTSPSITNTRSSSSGGSSSVSPTHSSTSKVRADMTDDDIYTIVGREIQSGNQIGLWTQLFAQFDGDETKVKVEYIKQRSKDLIEQRNREAINLQKSLEADKHWSM